MKQASKADLKALARELIQDDLVAFEEKLRKADEVNAQLRATLADTQTKLTAALDTLVRERALWAEHRASIEALIAESKRAADAVQAGITRTSQKQASAEQVRTQIEARISSANSEFEQHVKALSEASRRAIEKVDAAGDKAVQRVLDAKARA